MILKTRGCVDTQPVPPAGRGPICTIFVVRVVLVTILGGVGEAQAGDGQVQQALHQQEDCEVA